MQDNKTLYDYPIDAVRYHFTQFNVWVAFFVAINGGLLIAYSSMDLKSNLEKILILLLGYVAAFLFHYLSEVYDFCINDLSDKIDEIKNDNLQEAEQNKVYFDSLRRTKTSTTKIVYLFSLILTYPWGILLISKFIRNIGKLFTFKLTFFYIIEVFIAIILVTIVNMILLKLARKFLVQKTKQVNAKVSNT